MARARFCPRGQAEQCAPLPTLRARPANWGRDPRVHRSSKKLFTSTVMIPLRRGRFCSRKPRSRRHPGTHRISVTIWRALPPPAKLICVRPRGAGGYTSLGRYHVEKIARVTDICRRSLPCSACAKPELARRTGQGNGRGLLRKLPHFFQPRRQRVHARGMAHSHTDDEQSWSCCPSRSARRNDGLLDQVLSGKVETRRRSDSGTGEGRHQGVASPHAWFTPA